jgi:hypothetical protein
MKEAQMSMNEVRKNIQLSMDEVRKNVNEARKDTQLTTNELRKEVQAFMHTTDGRLTMLSRITMLWWSFS